MKAPMTVHRTMQLGFVAVLALLLVVGAVAYRSVTVSTDSARWVQHSSEVLEHLAQLRAAVETIDSGYRDFALSGDDAFLQLSRGRISLVDQEQSSLLTLTADNPSQQRRLAIVVAAARRIIQRGDAIVLMRRADGAESAVDAFRRGQGDPSLNEFRSAAAEMEEEEHRLLHERNTNEERRYRESKVALLLGSILAILIAAGSGWLVLRDHAVRKEAENELRRLNRLYAMISGINALVIRVPNRDDLFRNFCRIAVEHGEFLMAWIGVVDSSEMKIVPMAWSGIEEQSMSAIRGLFASAEGGLQGKTLAARTIRDKTPVIANDVQNDKSLVFGEWHAEAGVRSIAMLPLLVADKAIGVFVLYTSKPEFFDAAGMHLLTELAGNVAFAIDHIEKQERLDHFAYYDALTGLANRSLFLDRVTQHMLHAAGNGRKLAVFLIDLERFKKFNDSLGRPAGDMLLKQVAEWLAQKAGSVNLLARVGADLFAMVLPQVTYEANMLRLLEKTIAAFLNHPFRVNEVV